MTLQIETPRASKAATVAGWIIGFLPAALLLFSAVTKLTKRPSIIEGFAKFGYPERLLLPIGIAELCCAVIYLIPRTAVLGAILVTGYFGGAIATSVRVGDPTWIMPALCGVLIWLGLYL